jgi:hypothetical protein
MRRGAARLFARETNTNSRFHFPTATSVGDRQLETVIASHRVARMRAKTSLPGLTRQSISFARTSCEEGWMPGSRLRQPPSSEAGLRWSRGFAGLSTVGPPKLLAKAGKSEHDECVYLHSNHNFKQHFIQAHIRILAARCVRGLHERSPKGRGERRMPNAPAASCAKVESTRVVTTGPPDQPGAPARNGFNGFLRALPGDRLVVTVACGLRFCLHPVGPTCFRQLDASAGASGPHDFSVRVSVVRQRAVDGSRETRPAITCRA